jgi:hypothetical protein
MEISVRISAEIDINGWTLPGTAAISKSLATLLGTNLATARYKMSEMLWKPVCVYMWPLSTLSNIRARPVQVYPVAQGRFSAKGVTCCISFVSQCISAAEDFLTNLVP